MIQAVRTAVLGLVLTGCGGKATALQGYAGDFNEMVQQQQNEQMLLNLVRLQYREVPLFLRTNQLTAAVTYQTSAGVGLEGGTSGTNSSTALDAEVDTLSETASSGVSTGVKPSLGVVSKRSPAVTFEPIAGKELAQIWLQQLTVDDLAMLVLSGWTMNRVLPTTLDRMGTALNDPENPDSFQRFQAAVELLQDVQDAGVVPFVRGKEPGELWMEFDLEADAPLEVSTANLIALEDNGFVVTRDGSTLAVHRAAKSGLHLTDDEAVLPIIEKFKTVVIDDKSTVIQTERFMIVEPGTPAGDGDVQLVGRSLADAMFYLSKGVQVPEDHRGLVRSKPEWNDVLSELMVVQTLPECPGADAYVQVQYRGHCFFIADDDRNSKDTFALLWTIWSLRAAEIEAPATISLFSRQP